MTVMDEVNKLFKYPLFGKESSPAYTAPRLSILGTIIFWLIFCICGLFIHPNKEPKFETVQIVLESTPIEPTEKKEVLEKSNTDVAKTTSEVESAKPTQEVIKETPAPVSQPKTETPKKVEQTPAKTEPKKVETPKTETPSYTKAPEYQIKKSVEELMAEQASSKQTKTTNDPWVQFDDTPTETVAKTAPVQKQIDNKSALAGSAGSAASSKTSSSTTTSTTSSSSSETPTVSSNTTSSLGKIAATSYSSKSLDGTSESVALVKSARTAEGKVAVAMDDGSGRKIRTSDTTINLSKGAIENDITILVKFFVGRPGNVLSDISFDPESVLSSKAKQEIINQISKWEFDPADYISPAHFRLELKVKK